VSPGPGNSASPPCFGSSFFRIQTFSPLLSNQTAFFTSPLTSKLVFDRRFVSSPLYRRVNMPCSQGVYKFAKPFFSPTHTCPDVSRFDLGVISGSECPAPPFLLDAYTLSFSAATRFYAPRRYGGLVANSFPDALSSVRPDVLIFSFFVLLSHCGIDSAGFSGSPLSCCPLSRDSAG